MIDSIKYFKVNEELYSNDKRFNIMKSKDYFKLVSPLQLFEISEVSNTNLMINCVETESSFNTEDSIGAIIVIDSNVLKMRNLGNKSLPVEKNKSVINDECLEVYSDINGRFYHHDEDDEDYNGDYEDDFSECDNKQLYRKCNNKSKKEKIKKQMLKEEKETFKNRMGDYKKGMCNSIKNNNCSYHQKPDRHCNINNGNEKIISPNNIPTPTEDIINMANGNYINPLLISNMVDGSSSPTKVISNINSTPDKLEATTIKQSTPQSIQSTPSQISRTLSINSNIPNNYFNNKTSSNPNNKDTIEAVNIISNSTLPKKVTQDITSAIDYGDNQAIRLINNDELLQDMTIEETIPVLNTKSIKVQGTSNKNQNTINTNISSQSSLSPTSPISYYNIGQNHDTPSEPVLYTDSIPSQENVISEEERRFSHQTMNSINYPTTPINNENNNNNNNNDKNFYSNQPQNTNKRNENGTNYIKTDNNKIYSQPYSRIYYPDSDIEVMEFRQGFEPSAPLESNVNNYDISNIDNYNNSNPELSSINVSSERSTEPYNGTTTASSASPPARPPSISKSIIFGVNQFPSPPENNDELDITNVSPSQPSQSSNPSTDKRNDVVIHQYYKNDLNDQPPSYENINNQPSAPTLSELTSNNTLAALIDNNNHSIEMDTSSSSIEVPNPSNHSSSESTIIVFFIIFLSQRHPSGKHLDYSIYTITRVSTTVSGTTTITKTLIHRPVTIQEKGIAAEPTPRSITSNTNEIDDFIIESKGKANDEGSIQWIIRELTNPYLVTNYFKEGSETLKDELASASFQLRLNRIIEINDTISISDSDSYFNLETSEDKVNFAFLTNNDSKTDIDVFHFSQYFEDELKKTNVTVNYLFTSQSINIFEPKFANLNPQAARCFLEIDNWDYKYNNSRLVIKSSITSSDLVWSVKEENVINLNNSEGKIILINGVETSRGNNKRNATLSLFEDVVEFEDEGVVDVDFLVSDVQKSNYLLVDVEVLLRSNVLDIMTKEYAESVNSVVSSSTTSQYLFHQFVFIKKLFNLPLFNNRFFKIQTLFNSRHLKILSIFISFFIQLVFIYI
ncbi:hypothetical protein PIROE2DRAFT_59113 [Piromyces sp. E2]|nr:hypothetical protein PIROE2DRAFT_59113 [Piromyces sp. E2]|eukprot:OUM66854.1 hypothetical protein PIROE2DRAFT_59113 [Piromyces sp. E2]